MDSHIFNRVVFTFKISVSFVFRGYAAHVMILEGWLRYFNGLAVGKTEAPACFLRENAEGSGMPLLLSH